MFGKLVIIIFVMGCALCAEEVQRNASDDKSGLLKKSDQKQTETSFMSKIASWIFPFGGDSVAAEDHQSGPQYLPPPSNQAGKRKDCNPCNKEPWIPVAANYGKNTIIGFMQPHELSSYDQVTHASTIDEFRPPLPSGGYGGDNSYAKPIGFLGSNNNGFINDNRQNYETYQQYASQHTLPSINQPTYTPPNQDINQYNQKLKPIHRPLINQPTYGPPKPLYMVPNQPNYQQPKHFGHQREPYAKNRPSKYIPLKLKPSIQYNLNGGPPRSLPTNMRPPPLIQPYAPFKNNYPPVVSPPRNNPAINFKTPFNNYFPPNQQQFINPDYIPPPQQLPLSSGPESNPIPLPNLSSNPIAPLHNAQPFRDNYPQPGSKIETHHQSGNNVEILKSISVADYLASVEHPINVIRSPLLEVDVANASSHSDNNEGYSNNNNYKNIKENDFNNNNNYKNIKEGDYGGFKDLSGTPSYDTNSDYVDNSGAFKYDNTEYNNPGTNSYDNVKLSDNPIVVDDTHAAASSYNSTYRKEHDKNNNFNNLNDEVISGDFINQIINGVHNNNNKGYRSPAPFTQSYTEETTAFTEAPEVYSSWPPEIVTSMMPPPVGESYWTTTGQARQVDSPTKKPKQIQIIIPYTTNNNNKLEPQLNQLPLFTQPPNIESVWMQHNNNNKEYFNGAESKEVTVTNKPHTTEVINIKDLFKGEKKEFNYKNLPFDIIRLQKNIDGWTEQEFANKMLIHLQKTTTTTRLVPSKQIPDEYLTTLPYDDNEVTTSKYPKDFFDHEPAGTNSKEYKYKEELETNLITETTTLSPTLPPKNIKSWDKIHISVSPLTKEKVYVVTPQPISEASTWKQEINTNSKFSITIMPMKNKTENSDVRIVLSEWPHLINNLATTTTSKPRPSRHPLFGLMDLSSYAPPANSTIQTYSGHSKVINAVTSTVSAKKKVTDDEKKTTTPKTTTLHS